MPFKSKKAQAAAYNIAKRWKQQETIAPEHTEPISADDGCNKGCQTNSERFRSVQTQTYLKPSNTIDQFDFENVSDLIDLLIDSCQNWNSINNRILSLIIYLTIRLCKIQYEETRLILLKLNLLLLMRMIHALFLEMREVNISENYFMSSIPNSNCKQKHSLWKTLHKRSVVLLLRIWLSSLINNFIRYMAIHLIKK